MKRFIVIVAGGKGLRMGSEIPKQFLLLNGKPVLIRTMESFYSFDSSAEIIVVLPQSQIEYWKELCEKYGNTIPHKIVEGGKERFYSVQNGINSIKGNGLVAVHDGVRSLVSKQMLERGFTMAEQCGCAVPFVDSVDSLRIIDGDTTEVLNRSIVKRIQTPQIFDVKRLQQVMNAEYRPEFTDEATVWELSGNKLYFYEGDFRNIKITTPEDLRIAEMFAE